MATNQPSKIYLNSKFRQTNESNFNFSNFLQTSVIGAKEVDLDKMVFPNLIYHFKSSNNTLVIDQDTSSYEVSIPTNIAFSNGDNFAGTLNNLFANVPCTISASYDSSSNLLQLTDASGFTISDNSTCLTKIGFVDVTQNATVSDTHTATGNLLLNGTSVIYVRSSLTAGDTTTPFGGRSGGEGADLFDIISMVPISNNYGDIVEYQSTVDRVMVSPISTRVQNITIALLDEDFEYLNIAPNADIAIELSCQY